MKKTKRWITKHIIEHPFRAVICSIGSLFVFVYIFLGLLRLVDFLCQNVNVSFFNITRFNGGVEAWFAFYGSFFGAMATVILGIITLRLDIKMNQSAQASEINKLNLLEIRLYDRQREFRPSDWINGDDSKRFMLEFVFARFEPYYSIEVIQILWCIFNSDFTILKKYPLDKQVAYIKTSNKLKIYVSFDDIDTRVSEHSFNFFYRIQCFEPILMPLYEKQRQLELKLKLKNTLYCSDVEETFVNLTVKIEYGGFNKGYVILKEKDCKLNITEAVREGGV